jgi:Outer membrane protein beta-barrel domain
MCVVRNRQLTLVFPFVLLFLSALSLRAQVAPAAYKSPFSLSAGGEGSMFQPDYAGAGVAEDSPDRLYGVGAYVDARFTRWVQIEAEARWLRFNEYAGIGENTYMIGPKVPVVEYRGLEPYGKFLFGWGSGSGSWLTGRAGTFAYGGGLDYHWTRKITIRAIDFEYQDWRVDPTLNPYGGSVGISYTFLGRNR